MKKAAPFIIRTGAAAIVHDDYPVAQVGGGACGLLHVCFARPSRDAVEQDHRGGCSRQLRRVQPVQGDFAAVWLRPWFFMRK
jgi:hypothetical protein